MPVIKVICVLLLQCLCFSLSAQQQGASVQTNSLGQITNLGSALKYVNAIDEITIYGGDNKISYSDVKGSRFWKDEWQQAALYKNNALLGIVPVKLNLTTSEIYFLKNNEEKVVTDAITSIIFFKENDSSVATAAFMGHTPNLFFENKKLDDFVQVLNYGNSQLLKYTKRKISVAYAAFNTQKSYHFSDDNYYFLKSGEKIERVKKLSKENILQFLPGSTSLNEWIKSTNIDFKKEGDVVRFLNYYNDARMK